MGDNLNGLNIDTIRKINKVRIMLGGREFFSAYSNQSVGSFSTAIKTSSVTQQVGNFLTSNLPLIKGAWNLYTSKFGQMAGNVVGNTAGNAYSVSAGINYDAMYTFTGTDYFTKSIQCYLQVEDDFVEDIAKPLYKLLSFVLPSETDSFVGDIIDSVDAQMKAEGFYEKGDSLTIKNVLSSVWETMKDYGDSLTAFKTPEQFYHSGHYRKRVKKEDGTYEVVDVFPDNGKTLFSVMIGNHIKIENVIISKIAFDIPNLLTYEDGLFDRVNITMDLLGTRSMSIQTYDWVRKLSNAYGSGGIGLELKEPLKPTLNNMFDNPQNLLDRSRDTRKANKK
jgi:hypothetical protein